jgi:hypothetical protein
MSITMTYDSLVSNIQQYMERTDEDFIAQIPNLIALAESCIAAELKTYMQLTVVETNLAINQTVLNKPARWRKTVSMKVNGQPILLRSQDYVSMYLSESSGGQPQYYADYDFNNWNFAPAPDASYPVEIIYFSEIQPLDENNQQNLWTAVAPQAMLYGALLQAQGYLKALDKLPVWKQYYTDAVTALKKEDDIRRVGRNTSVQEP